MTPMTRTMSSLALLLAAAVVVLQFAAVQHSIEHGGTLPDIGCEFCVSGAASASLSTHPTTPPAERLSTDAPIGEPAASAPNSRRTRPPARGPPTLA